jgi:hypothetical protein
LLPGRLWEDTLGFDDPLTLQGLGGKSKFRLAFPSLMSVLFYNSFKALDYFQLSGGHGSTYVPNTLDRQTQMLCLEHQIWKISNFLKSGLSEYF